MGTNTSGTFILILLSIFVVLKLTNNITWSWLWVLSPLWIYISLFIITILIVLLIYSIMEFID